MRDYEVTIVRKITTIVKVNSASRAGAIRQVIEYGPIEATSDYRVCSEDVEVKVVKAKEA